MLNTDEILSKIPNEFRSILSNIAYEKGHSAGEDEVNSILNNLVNDLLPVIDKFSERITKEAVTNSHWPNAYS